jgi:hypothetical protein
MLILCAGNDSSGGLAAAAVAVAVAADLGKGK